MTETGIQKQTLTLDALVHKYWHALFFLLYLIVGVWFALLERYIVSEHWVSCVLDQYIPFLPVFVIPYVLWFPMIAVVLITLFFSDRNDFIKTISLLCAGMFVANVIFTIYPNGQSLRPIVTGNDIFSRMVRYTIYANDTNTNTFPSLHVLNQMAIYIGLCKSKQFQNNRRVKLTSLILTIFICASTCFIKQHSILDVLFALILEFFLYMLVYKVDWSRAARFAEKEKSPLKE